MKYTVQAIKYVVKNFIFLLPFVVVPAIFLSFSTDEIAIRTVLRQAFSGNLNDWTFNELFRAVSILNFSSWQSITAGVLAVLTLIFCAALLMAFLEKHMRIGKRSCRTLFPKLNDNFLSTFGYVLLLLALYEVWALVTVALLFFVSRLSAVVMAYIFICIVVLAMFVVLLYVISMIYLWLPCMQITGFKPMEALNYSSALNAPVKWAILVGQLFFLCLTELAIFVCAWFSVDLLWFTVTSTAFYIVLIMVYTVRMQIVYFDRDNIDRVDTKAYYRR
jgi:hypothetical protein